GGGQATQGLSALPWPRRFCMHDAPVAVEPSPIGPSELDKIQRRCPMVVSLPGSIMYPSAERTPGPLERLLLLAPSAPASVQQVQFMGGLCESELLASIMSAHSCAMRSRSGSVVTAGKSA